MSACGNIGPMLDGYFDGELDPSERTRVERHLAGCAVCRRDLASLGAVGNAVRATVAGTRSPDLWRGIEAQLRAPRATPAPRRSRAPLRRRWLPGAAAAAAVASVFLATFQLAQPLPPVADAGPSGVVRSIYAPERPVMVMEAEKSDDPTIIWLMDDPPAETEGHVRI
jgi:anti-sigma factor RsiW